MKPAVALAAIVLSVLAAVAIQELRIQRLRDELIELRAIRTSTTADRQQPAAEPVPAAVPAQPAPAAPAAAVETPSRGIPDDFPEPDDERSRALAQGPYAELHYELGLSNRERAYLDHLLLERGRAGQEAAHRWLETPAAERAAIEDELSAALAAAEQPLAAFFISEFESEQFHHYDSRSSAREFLEQLRPLMDQNGLVLGPEQERELLDAIHRSREAAGATRWNSLDGLRVAASGEALDRFDREWQAQEPLLIQELGSFLEVSDAATVLECLRELRQPARAQVEEMVRMACGADAGDPPGQETGE